MVFNVPENTSNLTENSLYKAQKEFKVPQGVLGIKQRQASDLYRVGINKKDKIRPIKIRLKIC